VPIFFLDSEFLILVLFQKPTTSKNGRSFHGEVATFISVIDGIRDIFEAWFIIQLCFQRSNIHGLLFKCDIYCSDVTIDRDHQRYLRLTNALRQLLNFIQ
jgi:hypothetical protein